MLLSTLAWGGPETAKMQTIVISGATGFLGSHLAHRFVEQGNRVIALVRNRTSLRRLSDIADRVQFCNVEMLDLETQFQDLKRIDVVINAAADYGRQGSPLSKLVETNILWGLRLAEAAGKVGTTCFLNAGSALSPEVSPYALSKRQFSQWGKRLAEQQKLHFVDVLLEHIYGEDDDTTKFVAYVIVNCLRNIECLPLTAGTQKRDFVYIEDVASAFVRLVELATDSGATASGWDYCEYAVGSGQAVTIRELAQLIQEKTETHTILDFGALSYRDQEVMYSQADISALRAQGWMPRYSLREGIARTVAWYKTHCKEIETCVG